VVGGEEGGRVPSRLLNCLDDTALNYCFLCCISLIRGPPITWVCLAMNYRSVVGTGCVVCGYELCMPGPDKTTFIPLAARLQTRGASSQIKWKLSLRVANKTAAVAPSYNADVFFAYAACTMGKPPHLDPHCDSCSGAFLQVAGSCWFMFNPPVTLGSI